MGKDNPNATFSGYAKELDFENQPVSSGFALYGKAMAGIPETLQNVILPEPIRREIEEATGFDIDVGNVFEPLFGAFTELQKQKQEQKEANK